MRSYLYVYKIKKEESSDIFRVFNFCLSDMITKIEEIYDLTVMNKDICNGLFFSGWVSTQNRDEALEVIMGSCGLGYDLDGNILTIKH